MKRTVLLLLVFIQITYSFAQNVDWINAPLNPVPDNGSVSQKNLKGDVFQLDYYKFSRDGKLLFYRNNKAEINIDASGIVRNETNILGGSDSFQYNSKGLRSVRIRGSYGQYTTYTYDQNDRLVKEVYKFDENWTKDYTYKTDKETLIIIEKQTGGDRPYEMERRFKNGLEVQSQNGAAIKKYEYEFDKKGNWIKRITRDAKTNQLINEVETRSIIYYDEYDKGLNAISVVVEKNEVKDNPLRPSAYINNKKYDVPFSRLDNNYIFYDVLSRKYYVARDGYNSNNSDGQKLAVEELLSSYEISLLYDGKKMGILENGRLKKSINEWSLANYYGFIVTIDSVRKKSYAFGPLPKISEHKLIALGGKDMMNDVNKVSYIINREKKGFYIFENGKSISITSAAVLEGDLSLVMIVNGTPKFVTPPDKARVENVISPARYFDPAKDKILTKKTPPAANSQTSASVPTSVSPPVNNSNGNLSTDSRNYLSVYKNNPEGVKEHLAALYNTMLQKKYPPTMISGLFAIMSKEVFAINEDAAFALLMKMPTGVGVRDVLTSLPKDMREVIGKRARAKVATYAN